MDSIYILINETYKILFLLIPVLVTVAMIVWLDREFGHLFKKEEAQMLLDHLVCFNQ